MLVDERRLDRNQAKAVRYHKNTPVMLVGDAGTGKATVVAHRVRWLLEQGVDVDEILILVPRKQSGAVERLTGLFREIPELEDNAPEVREVHELCRSIVAKNIDDVDRLLFWDKDADRIEVVYGDPDDDEDDEDDELASVAPHRKVQMISEATRRKIIDGVVKGFSNLEGKDALVKLRLYEKIRRLKSSMLWPHEVKSDAHFWQYLQYERVMKENKLLDSEDIPYAACKLFENKADLRQAFRERYRHVIVLDYQDLTRAEQRALKTMFGRRHHLMLVGSKDQAQNDAKYGFADGMDLFAVDYDEGEIIKLDEVHRPVPRIDYVRANEEWEELRLLEGLIDELHEEGYTKQDIAVFCHTAEELRIYGKRLTKASVYHLMNAKGREFKVVILPGMDEEHVTRVYVTNMESRGKVGLGARSIYRHIYQGITRATERVILSWVTKRTYGDMVVVSGPSTILDSVKDDMSERARGIHDVRPAGSSDGVESSDLNPLEKSRKREKPGSAETISSKCS